MAKLRLIQAREAMLLEGAWRVIMPRLILDQVIHPLILSIDSPILTELHNQGNGGHGGNASSGTAYANGGGAKAYSGAGGKATGGSVDRRALINIRAGKGFDFRFSPQGKYGRVPRDYDGLVNAFSGTFSRKLMALVGS
jgi:hypothetical protein